VQDYLPFAFILLGLAFAPLGVPKARALRWPRWRVNAALLICALGFDALLGPAQETLIGPWRSWTASQLQTHNLGALPLALNIIFSVFLLDLIAYSLHRLEHRQWWLWGMHRVHHADPALDFSTHFRVHPFTVVWHNLVTALLGMAMGVRWEGLLTYSVLMHLVQLWAHTPPRLSLATEHRVAWLLVTPRVHQRHHHPERREHDSNYGHLFTLWDRAFGSFNAQAISPQNRGAPAHELGLRDTPAAQINQLGQLLRSAFRHW
jgi:sterol desaturase/sphingolipid hydroxylase (fatty acid hydroxylase superfamily)